MRLPDRLYRRLERVYFDQRTIRRNELNRRVAAEDVAIRAWANKALAAHNASRCLSGCPYAHPPQLQPRSNDGKVTP